MWQRSFGGRQDVIGSVVKLGDTPATVDWRHAGRIRLPVQLRCVDAAAAPASYGALEGGAISVIGRLAAGVTRAQADAELRVLGERTAAALAGDARASPDARDRGTRGRDGSRLYPARAARPHEPPVLLVLLIACMSVGTLVYARTATREGEIALRSALGASRARIIGQLFVETLVLASLAAAVGLIAADRGADVGDRERVHQREARRSGSLPAWLTTILYAGGLAIVSAAMLSLLPALRVTRARVQPHLANLGTAGATLRFGRVWTGAMITQVALTAIGIPVAMEGGPGGAPHGESARDFQAGSISPPHRRDGLGDEETSAFEERRARTFADLERRVAQEPGVVAVTFADRAPGAGRASIDRRRRVLSRRRHRRSSSVLDIGGGTRVLRGIRLPHRRRACVPRWRPGPAARTVIVNEAFVRGFRPRRERIADRRSSAVFRRVRATLRMRSRR